MLCSSLCENIVPNKRRDLIAALGVVLIFIFIACGSLSRGSAADPTTSMTSTPPSLSPAQTVLLDYLAESFGNPLFDLAVFDASTAEKNSLAVAAGASTDSALATGTVHCTEDTYGELSPRVVIKMLQELQPRLTSSDVFYDMGSGRGPLASLFFFLSFLGFDSATAYLTLHFEFVLSFLSCTGLVTTLASVFGAKRAVGVEMGRARVRSACRILKRYTGHIFLISHNVDSFLIADGSSLRNWCELCPVEG